MKLSEWKNTFNLNQMNFTSTHLEEVTDEPGTKLVQSRPFVLLVFTSYTHGDIIKLEPDWCRTFKIPVFCDLKSRPIFFFFQTHLFVCSYLFTPLCRLCSERLVVFLAFHISCKVPSAASLRNINTHTIFDGCFCYSTSPMLY